MIRHAVNFIYYQVVKMFMKTMEGDSAIYNLRRSLSWADIYGIFPETNDHLKNYLPKFFEAGQNKNSEYRLGPLRELTEKFSEKHILNDSLECLAGYVYKLGLANEKKDFELLLLYRGVVMPSKPSPPG